MSYKMYQMSWMQTKRLFIRPVLVLLKELYLVLQHQPLSRKHLHPLLCLPPSAQAPIIRTIAIPYHRWQDHDIVEVEPTFELKVNISSSEESIEYELQNVPDVLDANQKVVHSASSSSTERIVSSTATSAVVKKTSASTVVSASKCPGTHHQDHSHTIPPVAGSMHNCVINLNINYN